MAELNPTSCYVELTENETLRHISPENVDIDKLTPGQCVMVCLPFLLGDDEISAKLLEISHEMFNCHLMGITDGHKAVKIAWDKVINGIDPEIPQ